MEGPKPPAVAARGPRAVAGPEPPAVAARRPRAVAGPEPAAAPALVAMLALLPHARRPRPHPGAVASALRIALGEIPLSQRAEPGAAAMLALGTSCRRLRIAQRLARAA